MNESAFHLFLSPLSALFPTYLRLRNPLYLLNSLLIDATLF